ncbi:4-hydroxythreonine-4-phosphate dehydrogenase PdxA [Roseateles oligotrophus]|uniref:4-hydroxythreonine-4-phosphate dehydrogenase PdxA n=1 Tax=Roseateles oligotrophus TaxID=1769250 RepID=A0ABT2Y8P6_9BURK|nr:4-hydroxythreonine-4-phosphate dehydrogenase PdxA [Roseateles oligotrophus]MCV2366669.1 4-hydroxythreonine-4-phosphate dehydrogenase PdxA [Roseateles oligotrophus]
MKSMSSAKTILVTMGDLCGIGPEIVAMAVAAPEPDLDARLCVLGDVAVMRRAMAWTGVELPLLHLSSLDELVDLPPRCVAVWQPDGLPAGLLDCCMGAIDAKAGAAAAVCIEAAVRAIQAGKADALVTAPIHKEALHAAGIGYPGHTEMLQALAAEGGGAAPVRMMLANNELRTVLVTIHCSLRQAIDLINIERVLETVRIAQRAMLSFGIAAPRIAVAGLNPHAGEGGLFGDEEIRHIAPAIAQARAEGIDASGPFAPDTVFMRARDVAGHPGEFDVVVAMTHDHGLIPVKYLGVEQGVNVTLGLPFVRTSPDHGTAFDVAGSGRADASSLKAALAMACRLLPLSAPRALRP